MSEEIYLEKKTGYAIMTINRPKQMNALNTGIVEQIDKLLDEVEADPSIRCLIITGAGEKSFIAGADIGQMGTPGYQPADAHYLITCGYKVYNRVEGLKIPTIAAINGYCLGGGLELAMCCDFRICSAKCTVCPAGDRAGHHSRLGRYDPSAAHHRRRPRKGHDPSCKAHQTRHRAAVWSGHRSV